MVPDNILGDFKCEAAEVINIKLIDTFDEFDDEKCFHPDMTHQLFGENETIFGYKNLNISLFYFAGSLSTYFNVSYKNKIPKSYGLEPDDVEKIIADKIPSGYIKDVDTFMKQQSLNDNFNPHGHLLHSFEDSLGKIYEIYVSSIKTEDFVEYYNHLQFFTLLYIDAASYIDLEDEKWQFFLMYEKKLIVDSGDKSLPDNKPKKRRSYHYHILGWANTYEYYAYPDKVRPRISQFLILPPYQRKSYGSNLLHSIYTFYTSSKNVLDITVETPSSSFTYLRDVLDAASCLKIISKNDEYKNMLPNYIFDKKGANKLESIIQNQLLLNKVQTQKILEILYLNSIKYDDENYKRFEEYMRLKIAKPLLKENEKFTKLNKSLFTFQDIQQQVNQILGNTLEHSQIIIAKLQKQVTNGC